MKLVSRNQASILMACLISVGSICLSNNKSFAIETSSPSLQAREAEATSVSRDAYIFGYPLVTMELTRQMLTNVSAPDSTHAPMGQFVHLRNYPSAEDKFVTTPNADTLYSLAWLDLTKEPYILSVPEAQDRYYLLPILSAWTEVFANPGTRTTGTKAQQFAITGPSWQGQLPKGVKEYKSPTNLAWILERTYCTGTEEDYAKVHTFQDKFTLVPLSSYGKHYTAPAGVVDSNIDMKTPARDQVNQMDAVAYFKLLTKLMKDNPPLPTDAPIVAEMAKLKIVPGQEFDIDKLDSLQALIVQNIPKEALERIMLYGKGAGKMVNGWAFLSDVGNYGSNYMQRAYVTMVGLGANRPSDAIYCMSENDADGNSYDGSHKYVMHFEKGHFPPVNAFWSLTMYDKDLFFVPNIKNRYTLGSRTKFKYNKDGSLDLYIQKDEPTADKESNWLPAPDGKFRLTLRMYWPKAEAIKGKYTIPAVKLVR